MFSTENETEIGVNPQIQQSYVSVLICNRFTENNVLVFRNHRGLVILKHGLSDRYNSTHQPPGMVGLAPKWVRWHQMGQVGTFLKSYFYTFRLEEI